MGRAVTFKRVAEAFDRASKYSECSESSGSEHSFPDLSDLVNGFLESDEINHRGKDIIEFENNIDEGERDETSAKELLEGYLHNVAADDHVKKKILVEVELAWRDAVGVDDDKWRTSPEFKHRLMSGLRERGLDAGLCKSKWGKTGGTPAGYYEYIDINVAGSRYIVEVYIAAEFEIARPTESYASLLQLLPPIFVGKAEELKQIVRLMCLAMRRSLKSSDMHMPPWRRNAYMYSKWFNSNYKRIINEVSDTKGVVSRQNSAGKRTALGFVPPLAGIRSSYCRENVVDSKEVGMRVGNLAMVMDGVGMRL